MSTAPDQPAVLTAGSEPVQVRVRVSARARHLRITVAPGRQPELVVPLNTRRRSIERMVENHRPWILRKTQEMEALAAENRLGLDRSGVVWLEGEALPVRRAREASSRSEAAIRDGFLQVSGRDPEAAVERWYRREAREALILEVEDQSSRLGLTPGRLSVRDQRTRWGSCSQRGDLSFSWRLILLDPSLLRYVVVHELCHLRELNHSLRFWALLDAALPGWKAQADWLKEHSFEIGSYRPRIAEPRGGAR